MKVVIFCGGLGMRIRESGDDIPKPMVPIGYRPILWHLMKYYAHYGHKDFVLCLGHKADVIKKYFLNYEETISNDFVLSSGGRKVELMKRDARLERRSVKGFGHCQLRRLQGCVHKRKVAEA